MSAGLVRQASDDGGGFNDDGATGDYPLTRADFALLRVEIADLAGKRAAFQGRHMSIGDVIFRFQRLT